MNKCELLKKLSAASFAVVDLNLFLDTHPNNAEALKKLNKYQDEAAELADLYVSKFGPLSPQDIYGDQSSDWVNGPWPWERCFTGCDN